MSRSRRYEVYAFSEAGLRRVDEITSQPVKVSDGVYYFYDTDDGSIIRLYPARSFVVWRKSV